MTSRLGVTINSDEGAEVDDHIRCLDATTQQQAKVAHYQGTNHKGAAAGELDLYGSLLFKAPATGQYTCQLLTLTSDGTRTDYHMAAKAGSTYLAAGSTAEVGPYWWQNNTCDVHGTDPNCVYLGGSGDPTTRNIFLDDHTIQNPVWNAPANALVAEVIADLQITSCPSGTDSCKVGQWGSGDQSSTIFAYLQFYQLDQAGGVCRTSGTPSTQYSIPNSVHHFSMRLALPDVPISTTCGGSRQFRLSVAVRWFSGNPVKIDGSGAGTRSTTHASVIVKSFDTTTTVPAVIGLSESAAGSAIQAAGLTVGAVSRVTNAAPAGIVIDQNAPGSTIEPVNSPVDFTVSAGPVPNVIGLSESAAGSAIQAAQLRVGTVSRIMNPTPAGIVIGQNPVGGTVAPTNSPVNLTVSAGQATVPSVIGDTQTYATSAINASGLIASFTSQSLCIDPGYVINQYPSGGTLVPPGATVFFTVDTSTPSSCEIIR